MFRRYIPPWGWSFNPYPRGGLICRITFLGRKRTIHVSTDIETSRVVEEVTLSDDQSGKYYRVQKRSYSSEAIVSTFDPNVPVWSSKDVFSDPLPMSPADHEEMVSLMKEEAGRSPTPFPVEVKPIWEDAVALCQLLHYRPKR